MALDSKDQAHYLCGLLNSEMVREYVESHNVAIQVGDIFKHMRLPLFQRSNTTHRKLTDLVEQAHREGDAVKHAAMLGKIRRMAEALLDRWAKTVVSIQKDVIPGISVDVATNSSQPSNG